MPNAHPRPYRAGSIFGTGPRRPLDREQRARFRFLLNAHRRARRVTPLGETIGNALVRRLGTDGQLDPSHDTLAADAGCSARTVRRALDAMKALGLLVWQRRLVRDGWRTEQASSAYVLVPSGIGTLPPARPRACGGQNGRQTRLESFPSVQTASAADVRAARDALARRRAAIEARLLGNG
jgi:hypothetical protein